MKKILFRSLLALSTIFLFPFQVVEACTGFIVGKDLTADGTTLYGRTEDLEPNHNKVFLVHPRKTNASGAKLVDETNGFEWTLPAESYKYTSVSDVTPSQGIFDEVGFNEYGVSISATVSAKANDAIQKVDPYVENGLAESILTTVVLPHVQTARQGVELMAQIVREQGAAEGNIITIADKTGVWYMEILSGHQYAAILFPEDRFAVFPNTFFLGHVDLSDTERTIASKDLEKVAKKANSYKEVDEKFHVSQSYNPPLQEADRSRVWSGIKSLDPSSPVKYDDASFDLLHTTDRKLTLRDAMNLQRNRLEGTKYKPQDQMELDGKGIPKKGEFDAVYKYPISNPNVMEAHIFQLKDDVPASAGGGTMWLSMGSPRNAPYLPYYGNILNTYQAYQELGDHYNDRSWYWTISRINDLVAKYPDLFEDGAIRTEMERLESQWMVEQDLSDQEQIALASQPEEASKKATEESLARAEKTFERLQEIRKEAEQKVADEHGKSALQDLDDEEDAAYEEKIDLVDFDYDYILAAGLFGATLLAIVIYLIRSKKQKGGKQDD